MSATPFNPLREIPPQHQFKKGDVLVVFGEVFSRGYVNGLIDEAEAAGMKVIYSTVGRRSEDQTLRPLTEQELAEKTQPLINVPLEAGFDLERASNGQSPVDQLKPYGLKGWEDAKLDWAAIEESRENGRRRFQKYVDEYIQALEGMIPKGANVIFVHTMAGGFPRAKVVMPIANKVFKGTGDRYLSSKLFWESEIGRLCDISFSEVTAETFRVLLQSTAKLKDRIQADGGRVSYLAFGYHGNEVLIDGTYQWYSYSPYLQGWAKVQLEQIAEEFWEKGCHASVFNVPEILTNSSSIFLGVEVVLYPLLRALRATKPDHPAVKQLLQACEAKLKDGLSYADVDALTQKYLTDPLVRSWPRFEGWPQHNGPEQMARMRETSTALMDMHKDTKDLMTSTLSEVVFLACGKVMLRKAWQPGAPVQWIGHDLVAKCATSV